MSAAVETIHHGFTITFGGGHSIRSVEGQQGYRRTFATLRAALDALGAPPSDDELEDAYWLPVTLTDNSRARGARERFEFADWIAVDIDFEPENAKHGAGPFPELWQDRLRQIFEVLLPSSAHLTPGGGRLIHRLAERCANVDLYQAAVRAHYEDVRAVLSELGWLVEEGRGPGFSAKTLADVTRAMFRPGAWAKTKGEAEPRHNELEIFDGPPLDALALAARDPKLRTRAWAPVGVPNTRLGRAVAAGRQRFPLPEGTRDCPICGRGGSFMIVEASEGGRGLCWSSNHDTRARELAGSASAPVGRLADDLDGAWVFDGVDVEAFRRRLPSPVELLVAERLYDMVVRSREPLRLAEQLVQAEHTDEQGRVLLRRHPSLGSFYRHREDGSFQPISDEAIKGQVWRFQDTLRIAGKDDETPKRFPPNPKTVGAIFQALHAVETVALPDHFEPPGWIGKDGPDPRGFIVAAGEHVDLATGRACPADPAFFGLNSIPVRYDERAAEPRRWLAFLDSIWGRDDDGAEKQRFLRQWFGLCLVPDTRPQKGVLCKGAKRGGKGTIARVLTMLLGKGNVASPTLPSLGQPFGLQGMLHKLLAVVSDARLTGRVDQAAIVENLLRVTGEDLISVQRKYMSDIEVTLSARVMILSNEAPKLVDSSGALANRFVVLQFSQTFEGRESLTLGDELAEELPGILRWAVEGWRDLQANEGRLAAPPSSAAYVRQLEALGSPIRAFVAERCEVHPAAEVERADFRRAFESWCLAEGVPPVHDARKLHTLLEAAVPSMCSTEGTEKGTRRTVRKFVGVGLLCSRCLDSENSRRKLLPISQKFCPSGCGVDP